MGGRAAAPIRWRARTWRREPALLVLDVALVLASCVPLVVLALAGASAPILAVAAALTVHLAALALAAFSPRARVPGRPAPVLAALAVTCYLPVPLLGLPWADSAAVLLAALATAPTRWRVTLAASLVLVHTTVAVLVGRAQGTDPVDDPARLVGTAVLLSVLAWLVGVWRRREHLHDREVLAAVRSERLRIARDVHDVLGTGLTAISLKAGLARRHHELAEDTHLRRELDEISDLGSRTGADLRSIIHAWRSPCLVREVERGVAALRAAGATCEVRLDPTPLPPDVVDALAWVAGEALTNVLRHSSATTCLVETRATASGVRLRVVNDGVGAAARAGVLRTSGSPGFGLPGITERLALQGGDLVTSATGDIWELEAWLPVVPEVGSPGRVADGQVAL